MVIYKVTNSNNGKIYIGKTKRTLKERKREHYRDVSKQANKNTYFYNAIKKYNKEDMIWEEIDTASTLDELNQKEIDWITHYESYNRKKGYNIKIGGNKYGLNNGNQNSQFKKIYTDEEKDNIAIKMGKKPFIVFNDKGEEIMRGVNPQRISEVLKVNGAILNCLNNKHDFTGNYIAIYEHNFTQELLNYKISKMKEFKNNSYKGRWFLVYNKKTNELIGEFNSIKIASDTLKISHMSKIGDCLTGRQQSTSGYTFKWK